jgi:hypothetical protein
MKKERESVTLDSTCGSCGQNCSRFVYFWESGNQILHTFISLLCVCFCLLLSSTGSLRVIIEVTHMLVLTLQEYSGAPQQLNLKLFVSFSRQSQCHILRKRSQKFACCIHIYINFLLTLPDRHTGKYSVWKKGAYMANI